MCFTLKGESMVGNGLSGPMYSTGRCNDQDDLGPNRAEIGYLRAEAQAFELGCYSLTIQSQIHRPTPGALIDYSYV